MGDAKKATESKPSDKPDAAKKPGDATKAAPVKGSDEYFYSNIRPMLQAVKRLKLRNHCLQLRLDRHKKEYHLFRKNPDADDEFLAGKKEELEKMEPDTIEGKAANQKDYEEEEKEFWENTKITPDIHVFQFKLPSLKKTLTIHEHPEFWINARKAGEDYHLGHILWPGGWLIAKYLETACKDESLIKGKKIMDLGGGMGLLGLVAACLGGDVVVADTAEVIPQLRENIDRNLRHLEGCEGKIRHQKLNFGDDEAAKALPKQDILIMADVVYDEEITKSLLKTVEALSHDRTVILVAQDTQDSEYNDAWKIFWRGITDWYDLSPVEYDPKIYPGGIDINVFWFMRGKRKKNIE